MAILQIRLNAWVTGVLLAIELTALSVSPLLGLINFHADRVAHLFHNFQIGNAHGGPTRSASASS